MRPAALRIFDVSISGQQLGGFRPTRMARLAFACLIVASIGVSAASAVAATAPPRTHFWVNSCHPGRRPPVSHAASIALQAKVAWEYHAHIHGFSECLFVSKHGTFVLLDLASTWMLTRYASHAVTASQEFQRLDQNGGFPPALTRIGPKERRYLVVVTWQPGLQHDVVGVTTFGFFHTIHGRVPRFRRATKRLANFIDNMVMHRF